MFHLRVFPWPIPDSLSFLVIADQYYMLPGTTSGVLSLFLYVTVSANCGSIYKGVSELTLF